MTDYNNCPSHDISFMTTIGSTVGHLHGEIVSLLFFCFLFWNLESVYVIVTEDEVRDKTELLFIISVGRRWSVW